MNIRFRHYTSQPGFTEDFHKVLRFLKRIYEPGYTYGNWVWNRWEWAFSLPYLDETNLSRMGIWEADGEMVALACYETALGEVHFSLDKRFGCLKKQMIEHAMEYLAKNEEDGKKTVKINLYSTDLEFQEIAKSMGFTETEHVEQTAVFVISEPFPEIILPQGFAIVSLAEENDLHKVQRVLWRGFNHPGEPLEEELPGTLKMQTGPSYHKEITLAVKAPDGQFVSFCGMWYDPETEYAIVEPVATDPDYRGRGLGTAVVLEGIRRCGRMGAKVAYVGSGLSFYNQMGFKPLFENHWWTKTW